MADPHSHYSSDRATNLLSTHSSNAIKYNKYNKSQFAGIKLRLSFIVLLLIILGVILLVAYSFFYPKEPNHDSTNEFKVSANIRELLFHWLTYSSLYLLSKSAPLQPTPAAAGHPNIAIVMCDSRTYTPILDLILNPNKYSDLDETFNKDEASSGANYLISLSMAINLIYSSQFNHHLLLYEIAQQNNAQRLKEGLIRSDLDDEDTAGKLIPACLHREIGWRSSPWCKLLAINHALSLRVNNNTTKHVHGLDYTGLSSNADNDYSGRKSCDLNQMYDSSNDCPQYDYILFLDSDVTIISNLTILELYTNLMRSDPLDSGEIYFPRDYPFAELEPNSGIIFMKNTKNTRKFIQLWWNANLPEYNQKNTYEQHVLWPKRLGGLDYFLKYRDQYKLSLMEHIFPVDPRLKSGCAIHPSSYLSLPDTCSYSHRINSPLIHFAHIFHNSMERAFTTELIIQIRKRLKAINSKANPQGLLINPNIVRKYHLDGYLYNLS
jgi:hypothetical protein